MSEFETRAQHLLRESEQKLGTDVSQQLRDVRENALKSKKYSKMPSFLLPATGMAAASLVALVLVYEPVNNTHNNNDVLANENIELYEELDFYHWLASQESQLQG